MKTRCRSPARWRCWHSAPASRVGPDYQEPDVAWLNDWHSDLYGQIGQPEQQTQTDLRFWTQLFNEPELNGLVETARRENPTLRIAGLRILESRALLGIAGSNRYPQLNQVTGAAAHVEQQQRAARAGSQLRELPGQLRHGLGTRFLGTIPARHRIGQRRLFRVHHESARRAGAAERAGGGPVLRLPDDAASHRHRRAQCGIQKRSLEITEKIFKAGQDSELDVQQAKTQYLATLSTIPDLQATLVRQRNALAALLGRKPGEVPELASVQGPLPAVEPLVVQGIPAELLLRRPDIRTAAWQVAAQSAQIGVAKSDYFPAITLFGSIGWSANSLANSPDTSSLLVGPALSWNMFDFGRIRGNVRLQDARLQQTIEVFQDSVLQAAREIDDSAIGVVKTAEQQQFLDGAFDAAQRSLDLADTLYQEGYADFQRVLDAQRALFAQEEQQLLNHSAHISAIVALYKSIGGGWTDMTLEQMIPESMRETMQDRTNWGDLLTEPVPTDVASVSI